MEDMKSITATNYQKDKHYPAVARAVAEILETTNVVTPVDLLRAAERHKERSARTRISIWFGWLVWNLSKLSVILRLLDYHARTIGLKPSQTVYHKWGRGGKHIILRFSKSGAPALRQRHSRTTWRRTG